jgi:hypothetical protein
MLDKYIFYISMSIPWMWTFFGDSDFNDSWLQGDIFSIQFGSKSTKPALLYCSTTVFIQYLHEYYLDFDAWWVELFASIIPTEWGLLCSIRARIDRDCSNLPHQKSISCISPWILHRFLHGFFSRCSHSKYLQNEVSYIEFRREMTNIAGFYSGATSLSCDLLCGVILHLELQPSCSSTLCCCFHSLLMLYCAQTSPVLLWCLLVNLGHLIWCKKVCNSLLGAFWHFWQFFFAMYW